MDEKQTNKTKIHTVYKTKDGKRVPSVTTVLGVLNKPALLDWAWRLGTEGVDYKAVRDNAADIGTLAHYLVMQHLRGQKPDVSEYSPQDLDKAETCLIKFWEWEKDNPLEPILTEESLVSEQYGFGGTLDLFCKLKNSGSLVLVDFKTGKAIYSEYFAQVASYKELLIEHSYVPERTMILRIGRSVDEGFEVREIADLSRHFQLFLRCLDIYRLQAELRKS